MVECNFTIRYSCDFTQSRRYTPKTSHWALSVMGIERPGFANKPGIWRFVYGHEQDTRRSLPGILWMGVPIAPTKLETLPQGEGNRETPA